MSVKTLGDVVSIGNWAFASCGNLTNMEISNSVTFIGNAAFSGCSGLASIEIPDGVTSIGEQTFYNCRNLTSIGLPNSVTSIGNWAFYNCNSLQYNEYDNAYYLGNTDNPYMVLIKAKSTDIASCTINENTKLICYAAFKDCDSLTTITLPFVGERKDGKGDLNFGYIFGASSYVYNSYVPTSLKTVVITSAASIGYRAFNNCDDLTNIEISESVISIEDYAFCACESLINIKIPDSATSIGSAAFWLCYGLTSVEIGNSITSIGNNAFASCVNLTSLYYKGTAEEWSAISINSSGNTPLTNATRYYYSEEEPTAEGNFWHYDEDGNIVVW